MLYNNNKNMMSLDCDRPHAFCKVKIKNSSFTRTHVPFTDITVLQLLSLYKCIIKSFSNKIYILKILVYFYFYFLTYHIV